MRPRHKADRKGEGNLINQTMYQHPRIHPAQARTQENRIDRLDYIMYSLSSKYGTPPPCAHRDPPNEPLTRFRVTDQTPMQ